MTTTLPVPGFPGYFATDEGHVIGRRGWKLRGAVLPSGYHYVGLMLASGKVRMYRTNRLIALAFHGLGNPGDEARHLDGNRLNNAPSNLKWGTRLENADDKRRHGTILRRFGEEGPNAKITMAIAAEIRRTAAAGIETQRSIGLRFGVTQTLVSMIHLGKIWKEADHAATATG